MPDRWVVEANGVAWVDKLTGRRWSLVFDDVANLWTAANEATVSDALSSLVALVAGQSGAGRRRPHRPRGPDVSRLTQSELRALAEAAAFRLCGDHDDGDFDGEALASAHQKVSDRVRHWPTDPEDHGKDGT